MIATTQEEMNVNAAAPITREEVLNVLARLVSLKWRGIKPQDVPVQFMGSRIAVVLPAEKFVEDEQIRLGGKFQHLMTQRGAHGFLDFAVEWKGIDTRLNDGFN